MKSFESFIFISSMSVVHHQHCFKGLLYYWLDLAAIIFIWYLILFFLGKHTSSLKFSYWESSVINKHFKGHLTTGWILPKLVLNAPYICPTSVIVQIVPVSCCIIGSNRLNRFVNPFTAAYNCRLYAGEMLHTV